MLFVVAIMCQIGVLYEAYKLDEVAFHSAVIALILFSLSYCTGIKA